MTRTAISSYRWQARFSPFLVVLLALGVVAVAPVAAQQHTATRLGNPVTRFAPPLQTPADLRRTLSSEALAADVQTILRLGGYQGDWADFQRAVAEAEVTELKIPKGTRLPAMSSRENGRAILLRDVLWAGKEPIDAYEFVFSSRGRRYRVVTPKPCSNFWLEDQGQDAPVARPALHVVKVAPAEASLCDPIPLTITVRNAGNTALTQVQVTDPLPSGLQTADQQSALTLDAGSLQPGEGMEFKFNVRAAGPGSYENQVRATCAEGVSAQASASTIVRSPALTLACRAPEEVFIRRFAQICLTLRNTGDAPEPAATLTLPVPTGATFTSATGEATMAEGLVTWTLRNIAAGTTQEVCAVFTAAEPGSLTFAAAARGTCAPPLACQCATRVTGIPGVLLEVIDLDDPIEVGKKETYVIRVTNQGSTELKNVKLHCKLEDSQAYVSATGATAVQASDHNLTMEPVPLLQPKAQASWRVVVKALKAGDARFTTTLSCDQFQRAVEETESTNQY